MKRIHTIVVSLVILAVVAGCSRSDLPIRVPKGIPTVPALPSIAELPELWKDLGLPDLSNIPELPQISDLPMLQVPAGAVAYAGPTEQRIDIGQRIPGTDMTLTGINNEGAEFQIAGYHSVRKLGDSLDFDGDWPNIGGVHYTLRLRIYHIADNYVRAAGVQRLVIENVQPVARYGAPTGNTLEVPFTAAAGPGETIPGTTYRYAGHEERGAQIGGLPEGDYPYRKIGDSITWEGTVRPDIPARYDLRVVFYNDNQLQVAGLVTLGLP
jgi:hypothetical protein